MGKGGKIAMIIIGAILLIVGIYYVATAGAAMAAFQVYADSCNLLSGTLKDLCTSSLTLIPGYAIAQAAVTTATIIGVILLAVGAILLLVGLLKLKNA